MLKRAVSVRSLAQIRWWRLSVGIFWLKMIKLLRKIFGCWHEWGRWKDKPLIVTDDISYKTFCVTGQIRYCQKCGKKKTRW